MDRKTDIEINENILKATTKCKHGFSCLSGKKDVCKVELSVDNKIHFIVCLDNLPCSYRIPFGYSYVCTCPVRKELYNRYGI